MTDEAAAEGEPHTMVLVVKCDGRLIPPNTMFEGMLTESSGNVTFVWIPSSLFLSLLFSF